MKKNIFILAVITFNFTKHHAQVRINETDPKASLDINGDLIIKNVPEHAATFNKILTLNDSTYRVEYVNASNVNFSKSYLKGIGGIGFTILSATLLNGWNQISFPTIEIYENSDYNNTSQFFEAPADGIYYVYVKMTSLVNVSDLGIGIFKTNSVNTTLVEDESYESLSVSILGIGVTSPPTRSTETIVKLNAGDRIYFGIKSNNLIVFNDAEAQFSIFQLK